MSATTPDGVAHVGEEAHALVALAAGTPARAAAEAHAAACPDCARALDDARSLRALLADDTLEGPSPAALRRTLEAVAGHPERAPAPRVSTVTAALPALAAVGAFGLLVGLGERTAGGATAWGLALALAGAGAAFASGTQLPALARLSWPLLTIAFAAAAFEQLASTLLALGADGPAPRAGALATALLASIPFALARGTWRTAAGFGLGAAYLALRAGGGVPELLPAGACIVAQLGAALVPVAAAAWAASTETDPALARRIVARGAVGGALAATAALLLVCDAPGDAAHTVLSHGAGLALAAGLGAAVAALAGALPRRTPRASAAG